MGDSPVEFNNNLNQVLNIKYFPTVSLEEIYLELKDLWIVSWIKCRDVDNLLNRFDLVRISTSYEPLNSYRSIIIFRINLQ